MMRSTGVPDAAKTLALGVTFAFASVLALVYFFLKYGEEGPEGGDRGGRSRES